MPPTSSRTPGAIGATARALGWVLSLTLLVVLAAPAAGAAELVPGRPAYLALGDSIAAGVGAGTTPEERAEQGYVGVLHERLAAELPCLPARSPRAPQTCRGLQLLNIAVPGATTTTLIAGQLPQAVEMLRGRATDGNPRNDVQVVTVTVGGNDLFSPVIGACVLAVDRAACPAVAAASLSAATANLATILSALQAAAGDRTRIVVMTYANPLPACVLAPHAALADVVLEGGSLPALGLQLPAGFNDAVRALAATYGAHVAEAYGRIPASEHVGGRDCLHPNAAGHATLAGVFAGALGL